MAHFLCVRGKFEFPISVSWMWGLNRAPGKVALRSSMNQWHLCVWPKCQVGQKNLREVMYFIPSTFTSWVCSYMIIFRNSNKIACTGIIAIISPPFFFFQTRLINFLKSWSSGCKAGSLIHLLIPSSRLGNSHAKRINNSQQLPGSVVCRSAAFIFQTLFFSLRTMRSHQ